MRTILTISAVLLLETSASGADAVNASLDQFQQKREPISRPELLKNKEIEHSYASVFTGNTPVSDTTDERQKAFEWAGAYAGIHGGRGWMDGHFEAAGFAPLDSRLDGELFGAFVGFNRQFENNLVLSIEGDLEHNWNDVNVVATFGTISGGADWQGSVRTRIGYALDRILVYATAGWAATHVDAELIGIASTTESFGGYTAGAGVDYAVTDRIFARVDFRYNDFGHGELDFGPALAEADLTQKTLRMGLGIKF